MLAGHLPNSIGVIDGETWISTPEGNRPVRQEDIDAYDQSQKQAQQVQAQRFNSDPSMQQFTPQEVQSYMAGGSNPRPNLGIYNDGGNNLWSGPEGIRTNGANWSLDPFGDPFGGGAPHDMSPISGTGATDRNNMLPGLSIMALPFATLAGTAAAGAVGSETGSVGSGTLVGGAESDTLASPGLSEGNGMWDWLDGIDTEAGFDPGSSSMYNAPIAEDTSTGAFDQFGMDNPNTGFQDQGFDPGGGSWVDGLKQYGQKGLDAFNALKAVPGLAGLLGRAGNGATGQKQSTGGGILGNILNDPLGAAFNATPFLLALNEANRQGGDLNNVIGKINSDSYRKAVLDPFDLETGQGRAAMQSDLGQRGVAGSSFGYQALNNYDYSRNLARGDMASKADLASAGLEGQLVNQRNTNRNLLLGAGLNASGRLFSPQQDPFDLKKILGLS